MKRTLIIIAITTVVVLTLAGIASSSVFYSFRSGAPTEAPPGAYFGMGGGEAPAGGFLEFSDTTSLEAPAAPEAYDMAQSRDAVSNVVVASERLVIQNAELVLVVKNPENRMKEISDMAKEMGGYVVSSNLGQTYYGPNNQEAPEANITIRVPSERLDEALAKIKEGAVDVDFENLSGQDVTSQYVDLQSTLMAKQAAEKKLLEIMDNANRTEDVLAVYIQLQQIQSEIEVLKGQIKYYEESAALSAVSIRLIAEEGTKPIEIGPWRPEGAAKDAIEDLIAFSQNFVEFLIRFVLFTLPALVLIAIPLYLVYRGGRAVFRRFSKAQVKPEEVVKK